MRPRRAEGALHINDNGLKAQSNPKKEGLRPAQGKWAKRTTPWVGGYITFHALQGQKRSLFIYIS